MPWAFEPAVDVEVVPVAGGRGGRESTTAGRTVVMPIAGTVHRQWADATIATRRAHPRAGDVTAVIG
jgi:hypothetical protein